jgi:hypothetical protein
MDTDDEMIVVIVGDGIEQKKVSNQFPVPFEIKDEPVDEEELLDIIETAKKYGERLDVENDDELDQFNVKLEYESGNEFYDDDNFSATELNNDDVYDDDYVPDEEVNEPSGTETEDEEPKRKRWSKMTPAQCKSFVKELRQQYPELRRNEKQLVKTLSEIMRTVKRPEAPQDYYIMNDILFE